MPTIASTPAPDSPEITIPVVAEYIGVRAGYCGGKPHILGHRIKVQHIAVWHVRMGMTPEEIVATYPTISLSAIFAALAYYHSHRTEIDADIKADESYVAESKLTAGPSILQEKLAALHGKDDPVPPG